MDRKRRVEWLKIQRKGFFRHFLSRGLGLCIPFFFGGAFVKNDFYLNLSPIVSYRIYLITIVGAVFYSGCDWCAKSYEYKKYKKKYCVIMSHNKQFKSDS